MGERTFGLGSETKEGKYSWGFGIEGQGII